MDKISIYETVSSILVELVGLSIEKSFTNQELNDFLFKLMSNSTKAIQFVSIIEDEFDIEFDDDEIDSDFFYSLNNIVTCIEKYFN